MISKNTHTRGEGHFRLEWKLAGGRSHLMASDLPFLLPVVVDDTPDQEAGYQIGFVKCSGRACPPARTPQIAPWIADA